MGGRGGSSHVGTSNSRVGISATIGNSDAMQAVGNIPNATVREEIRGFPNGKGGYIDFSRAYVVQLREGIEIIYKKGWNKSTQQTSPEEIAKAYRGLDESFKPFVQKTIYGVDYENPQDEYWRQTYRNFTRSNATGGKEITFYGIGHSRSEEAMKGTLYHEAGHYIDRYLSSNLGLSEGAISRSDRWQRAMASDLSTSHRKSYSTYGENSPAEDFAESMKGYFTRGEFFKRTFPARAEMIDSILKELKPYV